MPTLKLLTCHPLYINQVHLVKPLRRSDYWGLYPSLNRVYGQIPMLTALFLRSFMLLTTEYIIEYAAFCVIERLD
jgi:hypothetical protein